MITKWHWEVHAYDQLALEATAESYFSRQVQSRLIISTRTNEIEKLSVLQRYLAPQARKAWEVHNNRDFKV